VISILLNIPVGRIRYVNKMVVAYALSLVIPAQQQCPLLGRRRMEIAIIMKS